MNYADARPLIRSGDVLGFTHKKVESFYDLKVRFVRLVTMSKYSHVATAYVDHGRVWVLEAVQPAPRKVPLSNLLPCDWVTMDAPWRIETEDRAIALLGKNGERYSELDAVRAYFKNVVPGADQNWSCGEWVWWLAYLDGMDLGHDLTPSGIMDAALRRRGAVLRSIEGE